MIYVPCYYERKKPRAQASVQGANSQPGSSEGRAANGGLVEAPLTAMVTETSIDCITKWETRDTENVEEVLHVDLETHINTDSTPINAPNLVKLFALRI